MPFSYCSWHGSKIVSLIGYVRRAAYGGLILHFGLLALWAFSLTLVCLHIWMWVCVWSKKCLVLFFKFRTTISGAYNQILLLNYCIFLGSVNGNLDSPCTNCSFVASLFSSILTALDMFNSSKGRILEFCIMIWVSSSSTYLIGIALEESDVRWLQHILSPKDLDFRMFFRCYHMKYFWILYLSNIYWCYL